MVARTQACAPHRSHRSAAVSGPAAIVVVTSAPSLPRTPWRLHRARSHIQITTELPTAAGDTRVETSLQHSAQTDRPTRTDAPALPKLPRRLGQIGLGPTGEHCVTSVATSPPPLPIPSIFRREQPHRSPRRAPPPESAPPSRPTT